MLWNIHYEYFETNICVSENVTAYAEQIGTHQMLFYQFEGTLWVSRRFKDETRLPTPETTY